jgi:hypothetical protein
MTEAYFKKHAPFVFYKDDGFAYAVVMSVFGHDIQADWDAIPIDPSDVRVVRYAWPSQLRSMKDVIDLPYEVVKNWKVVSEKWVNRV